MESRELNNLHMMTDDNEVIFLKAKIAELQNIQAQCKGDEQYTAAICAQIRDLIYQLERKETERRQGIFTITNFSNQGTAYPPVYQPPVVYFKPFISLEDRRKMKRMETECKIVFTIFAVVILIALALGLGLGLGLNQDKL